MREDSPQRFRGSHDLLKHRRLVDFFLECDVLFVKPILEILDLPKRLLGLSDIHYRSDELGLATLADNGIAYDVQILDRTIRHQQTMLEIPTFPVFENAVNHVLNKLPVIGMNSFHHRFQGWFDFCSVEFKNPEGFVRPKDLIPRYVPAKTPRVAESLSFGQVSLASPQLDRHLFLIGDVHRRADELGHHSVFENSSTYAPDVAQLAAGSDDPVFVIAAATFGRHLTKQFRSF